MPVPESLLMCVNVLETHIRPCFNLFKVCYYSLLLTLVNCGGEISGLDGLLV